MARLRSEIVIATRFLCFLRQWKLSLWDVKCRCKIENFKCSFPRQFWNQRWGAEQDCMQTFKVGLVFSLEHGQLSCSTGSGVLGVQRV